MTIGLLLGSESRKKLKVPDWDVGDFKDKDVEAACGLVEQWAEFAFPANPNLIPALWPVPGVVPTLKDLDFGHVVQSQVGLTHLWASQEWLKVDALLWHLQHAGKAMYENPFTTMPVVMLTSAGPLVVDGHHRLGALLLLGVTEVPVWTLPTPSQPREN